MFPAVIGMLLPTEVSIEKTLRANGSGFQNLRGKSRLGGAGTGYNEHSGGSGGTGRRAGFRCQWGLPRESSSLSFRSDFFSEASPVSHAAPKLGSEPSSSRLPHKGGAVAKRLASWCRISSGRKYFGFFRVLP